MRERLEAAGASHLAGGVADVLCGAGLRGVEDLGDGRFRIVSTAGYPEAPGSYAGIRGEVERAARECGMDATFDESLAGTYAAYILTPTGGNGC